MSLAKIESLVKDAATPKGNPEYDQKSLHRSRSFGEFKLVADSGCSSSAS
jgi:hypothetical protein